MKLRLERLVYAQTADHYPVRRMQLLTAWLVLTAFWSAGVLLTAYLDDAWTSTRIFGLLALPSAVLLVGIVDWLIALRTTRLDRR